MKKIKYVIGILIILVAFYLVYLAVEKEEPRGSELLPTSSSSPYTNTISYGLSDQSNKIIDEGTTINKKKEESFTGKIELSQDYEGEFSYYFNVLIDGEEVPYSIDGTSHLSASSFKLTDKESKSSDLTIEDLTTGKELMILFFKFPKREGEIDLKSFNKYSVLALRFNIDNDSSLKEFKTITGKKQDLINTDISLFDDSLSDGTIDLNKKAGSTTLLVIGNSSDETTKSILIPFINGERVHFEELDDNNIYVLEPEKSVDFQITLPDRKGEVLQIVKIYSPYQMDGFESNTFIDFSNPLYIK